MEPWFTAIEKFGPWNGKRWVDYVHWSGLEQLQELVSLDSMFCGTVLPEIKPEYWPHMPHQATYMGFFDDLNFLLAETSQIEEKNILCVFRNPTIEPAAPTDILPFEFLGYDLVEVDGSISSLSNCGGFKSEFSNTELSHQGLLSSHARALHVQSSLRKNHPEERHADCDVFAIFRSTRQ